jgi:hypothetical protein
MATTPATRPGPSRPLLYLAVGLLVLGLYAAVAPGGPRAGAFWTFLVAANLTGLVARYARAAVVRPATAFALAVLVAGVFVHTGPGRDGFVRSARTSPPGELILPLLLGADPNATGPREGRTPLNAALEWDRPDVALLLLDAGADPNRADAYGWTPLMVVRYRDLPATTALLRERGAREMPLPVLPRARRSDADDSPVAP